MPVDIHLYNVIFSAVLSVFFNFSMIISIRNSPKLTIAYKVQLYISAGLCLFYAGLNVWVNPSIACLEEENTVLFVKGGFDTSFYFGNFLLDVFIVLIMVTAIHPTVQFVYRYLHIVHSKYSHIWGRPIFWLLVLIPLFLAISSAVLFCLCIQPSPSEVDRYNETTYTINIIGYTSFLVASSKVITSATGSFDSFGDNYWAFMAMLYMALNMMIALGLIIFTAVAINRHLGRDQLSPATMKLHRQLNNTLTAQALIPFITIHLPFYVSCIAPVIGWYIYYLQEYLPFLFCYYSVLMPLSVVYYAKNKALLCCSRTSSAVSAVTFSASDKHIHWADHR